MKGRTLTHFDVKRDIRVKTDASHNRIDTSSEHPWE